MENGCPTAATIKCCPPFYVSFFCVFFPLHFKDSETKTNVLTPHPTPSTADSIFVQRVQILRWLFLCFLILLQNTSSPIGQSKSLKYNSGDAKCNLIHRQEQNTIKDPEPKPIVTISSQ